MFSSSFYAEMADVPQDTATKHMIKSPDMQVARVRGSCDLWVVHQLLAASTHGIPVFRDTVRDMAVKGVPLAFLARMSGVPVPILKSPERGIQFFAEKPDREAGLIRTQDHMDKYWNLHTMGRKNYDADAGDQSAARAALAGTDLGLFHTTAAPVPGEGDLPYYWRIPGLPAQSQIRDLGPTEYFTRILDWEERYQLPVPALLGPHEQAKRGF
jgi:hypothetical protein